MPDLPDYSKAAKALYGDSVPATCCGSYCSEAGCCPFPSPKPKARLCEPLKLTAISPKSWKHSDE